MHHETGIHRVLPDREPRAGGPPDIHDLGIRPRRCLQPRQKIKDQRSQNAGHAFASYTAVNTQARTTAERASRAWRIAHCRPTLGMEVMLIQTVDERANIL